MKKLSKEFIERVRRELIVDTQNYRYVTKECNDLDRQWLEIRRLPIAALDTTKAIDGWETVEVIEYEA